MEAAGNPLMKNWIFVTMIRSGSRGWLGLVFCEYALSGVPIAESFIHF